MNNNYIHDSFPRNGISSIIPSSQPPQTRHTGFPYPRSLISTTSTRLYGIRGFRSWFESQFPDAMITIHHPPSTLFIKELDRCCIIARPTKSIVLAFDGPASAAKLATQRRRRYGTVVRGELKREQLDILVKRGILFGNEQDHEHEGGVVDENRKVNGNDDANGIKLQSQTQTQTQTQKGMKYMNKKKFKSRKTKKKREAKHIKDEKTLCITPGTHFMERAHFPDAMITIHHPPSTLDGKKNQKKKRKKKRNSKDVFNLQSQSHSQTQSKEQQQQSQQQKQQQQKDETIHFSTDTFDHVLIDVNQLLHLTLRRSQSDGHALTLFIKELDRCCIIARPTKSIVLAFDGPASAAKLATQRRRRYGTVVRGELKREQLDILVKRGILFGNEQDHEHEGGVVDENRKVNGNDDANGIKLQSQTQTQTQTQKGMKYMNKKKFKSRKTKKKREAKHIKDEKTLCITPGTHFMERAHDAFLYWAWQRLSNPYGPLTNVRFYISPSTVPGEGEVKLLDWLLQAGCGLQHQENTVSSEYFLKHEGIVQRGDSVAIMGGDADLVLEGLVIAPRITHNLYVILPSTRSQSYAVSLWETTRTLSYLLGPNLDPNDMMRVRMDLVLLLIMNGNDYLPKLRGSLGFNLLFNTYMKLLKVWLKEEKAEKILNNIHNDNDGQRIASIIICCLSTF
eukprot:CAMPEP_0184871610 /NCGR_PEP_ID=MMETSP0580-20130426/40819_1 /TAXON_ID=1118495 /ORGANISM="Dactyliosolen fragilissimus" /LENGTH=678 /DNA_ID=CAMNT_0027374295 /DNA_START=781 /DNA_END=2820 /DNA_ORIENTATION=+